MRGCIRQRSTDSWTIVLYMGVDPVSGKKRQKWITMKGSKREAQRELTRLLREIDTGGFVYAAEMTVSEYLQKWLRDYAASSVSAKTYERYAEIINGSIIPKLGRIRLDKLRPLNVQAYYAEMLRCGRKVADGRPSARTVLHYHRLLRMTLKQAVRWQLLARNPCDAVEPPKPITLEMQVLTAEEVLRLLDSSKGSRYIVPVLLRYHRLAEGRGARTEVGRHRFPEPDHRSQTILAADPGWPCAERDEDGKGQAARCNWAERGPGS